MEITITEKQALYLIVKTIMSQSQNTKVVMKNSSIIINEMVNNIEVPENIYCPNLSYVISIMNGKTALHRFPNKMAKYIYLACWNIHENYNDSTLNVFFNKTNILPKNRIINNLCSFKGISLHKAEIAYLVLNTYLNGYIESHALECLSNDCKNLEFYVQEEIDYFKNINEGRLI